MKLQSLLASAAIFFLTHAGFSQTLITLAKPLRSDSWGYLDEKGEFVITARFRKCFEFSSEGLAPVLEGKSKQYQFINTKGEKLATEISEFKLKEIFGMNVQGFSDGMVPVRVGDKWGFLNTQGKVAIKPAFDKVTEFHEGYAAGQKAGINYIIDKSGKEIEIKDGKVSAIKDFAEGLAPFESADKKEGFIDPTGKIVIEPKFQSVGYFIDGLAWARTTENKIGFVNKKGEWIIEPQFAVAKSFEAKSGLARVKAGEKWQYTDKAGNIKTLNDSENFEDFSDGLCSGKKGGKVGFYDKTGSWVIEPQFEAVRDFKNGYAAAKQGGKWE